MFNQFQKRMHAHGGAMGKSLKIQSDIIMDATFTRDIAYRKCYIQEKGVIFPEQTLEGYLQAKSVFAGEENYNPKQLNGFKPIDAKYLVHTYTSITSPDAVDYYLQFRPLAHGKDINIRVGALIFIPDDLGVYKLWMIVQRDDRPQFPQFYVLQCDFLAKWYIYEENIPNYEGVTVDTGTYFSWCVSRAQSSYNSGVWTDYLTTTVENQRILWFPTNNDTRTITYNQRFSVSDNPYNRLAWEVSKREDMAPIGVTKITLKQEQSIEIIDDYSWVNITTDNISSESHGANYDFFQEREKDERPRDPVDVQDISQSVISFSGLNPDLKVGGSYKKFTTNFYLNGSLINNRPNWQLQFYKNDNEICSLNFVYNDNKINVDNSSGLFDINSNKVTYSKDGEIIFGIQYLYNNEYPQELQLKCLSIIDMIGGKIILSADDEQTPSTSPAQLELEVGSL